MSGPPPTESRGSDVAFILGAPRSGTTLLRAMLNGHAEVSCPAETGLPSLIAHTRHVWALICSSTNPREAADPLPSPYMATTQVAVPLPDDAEEHVRAGIGQMMSYYRGPNKRVYCDKSLGAVHHLAAIERTFPEARFIVLVRHVMDTILSGLEASPWGFNAFGYAPFVSASPENTVAALAQHWESEVGPALEWRRSHPEQTHLIRYEDLVKDPQSTLQGVFQFLGVAPDESALQTGLLEFSPVTGPGDYKLAYADGIDEQSVGRGRRVPVKLIPPPLLDRVNRLLTEADYLPMTDAWNSEPGRAQTAPADVRRALTDVLSSMGDGEWQYDLERIAIVADDDVSLRWVLEPQRGHVRPGDADVDLVIIGASMDLLRMLRRESDLGILTLTGRIRKMAADPDLAKRVDLPRMLTHLLGRFDIG